MFLTVTGIIMSSLKVIQQLQHAVMNSNNHPFYTDGPNLKVEKLHLKSFLYETHFISQYRIKVKLFYPLSDRRTYKQTLIIPMELYRDKMRRKEGEKSKFLFTRVSLTARQHNV